MIILCASAMFEFINEQWLIQNKNDNNLVLIVFISD